MVMEDGAADGSGAEVIVNVLVGDKEVAIGFAVGVMVVVRSIVGDGVATGRMVVGRGVGGRVGTAVGELVF